MKTFILSVVLLCCLGCHQTKPIICDTVPPVLPATSPAHTELEHPETVYYSYPSCPENMRLVFRSYRELKRLGAKNYMEDGYNLNANDGIAFKSAFCVSDWLDLAKEKP